MSNNFSVAFLRINVGRCFIIVVEYVPRLASEVRCADKIRTVAKAFALVLCLFYISRAILRKRCNGICRASDAVTGPVRETGERLIR
jgi:hypothetical protein